MRTFQTLRLIHRGTRRTFFSVHLGIFLSVFLLSLAWISARNVVVFARKTLIGDLPGQELLVETKKTALAMFQILEPGAQGELPESVLRELTQLPGVVDLFSIKFASLPVSIEGRFLGIQFGTEALIQGFDPAWIAGDVTRDKLFWEERAPVPVVLNTGILALYNNGYAKSNGLPELSEKALLGRKFDLHIRSRKNTSLNVEAKVVGLSPKVAMGVTLPNAVLDQLHEALGEERPPVRQVVLRVEPLADMASLGKTVAEMGYQLQEAAPLAAVFRQLTTLGRVAAVVLVAVALWVAFAYLNQAVKLLLLVKRRDYAMCRAMGISRRTLRSLIAGEVLIWGITDVTAGACCACAAFLAGHAIFLNDLLIHVFGIGLNPRSFGFELALLNGFIIFGCVALVVPRILWDTREEAGLSLNRP